MILSAVKKYIKAYMRDNWDYYHDLKLRYLLSSRFREHIKSLIPEVVSVNVNKTRNEKIRVVFICQVADIWNSLKPVYFALKNDPDIEACILACPEKIFHRNYDVSHEEYEENRAFSMCKEFDSRTINAYDKNSGTWFNLRTLNPDYVFTPRPYDINLPPCYRTDELRKYTKVCYAPYSYCKMYWDSRLVYNIDFVRNVYAVFTENEYYCSIVRQIMSKILKLDTKVEFFGYPRFDLYRNLPDKQPDPAFRKVVLWLPRWTTNDSVEATTFFRYKDSIIKYFLEHKDLKLICRPHPFMLKNFLSTGELTQSDVDAFMKPFREEKNFVYDDTPDYRNALIDADIFISDTSSLLVEEFITGKPIIFCGSMNKFDPESRKWAELMYKVHNEAELFGNLESLIKGQDIRKSSRHEYINTHMKFDASAGERIVEFLKEDFHNAG